MKNLGVFLETLLFEIPDLHPEFCVRSVVVIKQVVAGNPRELRDKFIDSNLPAVRDAMALHCLTAAPYDLFQRIDALVSMETSYRSGPSVSRMQRIGPRASSSRLSALKKACARGVKMILSLS